MITTALLALVPLAQDADVHFSVFVPKMFIQGEPFVVTVSIDIPSDVGAAVPVWSLTAAGFDLDGVPLGVRDKGVLKLAPEQHLESSFDLGQAISSSEAFQGGDFQLGYEASPAAAPGPITVLRGAERGIDFSTLPVEQLGDYDVVLQTMHGPIWLQLWSDVAPRHVANFLDLAYTGFYDDNHFHRVVPGFMIQGGGERPGRRAPRRLKNEFNQRRHVAGVLSMARLGMDKPDAEGNVIPQFDSATCEFFIIHRVSPHLDGKYTPFGRVVVGLDAVEKVVDSVKGSFNPRDPRTHRPPVRQVIQMAVVVKAPAVRPEPEEGH